MKREELSKEQFSQLVFDMVRHVPKGRATSYGTIAKAIGFPTLSRMVGKTMANSSAHDVPAHRVVNSQGILSGRDAFETPSKMQELLESEGISIENNRIKNWKKVFWNPLTELHFE